MSSTVIEAPRQAPDPGTSRRLGIALIIICVAQLMVVLDTTISNIAIPYISSDLGFGAASRSWIITGYTLAFGGLLLLGGRMGDIFGRRRVFMAGVVLFAVASLLGGLAQNEAMLLGARAIQGVGAAIASPTALALITTTFPAGRLRNRAFAVYAAMSGAGAAVGLVLGGWLTEYSWRWTFLINVPIGVLAAVAAPYFLNESQRRRGSFDLPGALSATLGLFAVVYGLTHAADTSWGNPWTLASLAVGLGLLAAFLVLERTAVNPLLPLRILAHRTRAISFTTMMLVSAALFALFFFISQLVQNVMGWSSLHAGVAFLPFSGGILLAAAVVPRLMTRVDPRWIVGVGTAMAGLGMFGFAQLPYDDNPMHLAVHVSYVSDLLPWIVLTAAGMGMTFVPVTLTAVHGVGQADSGVGSAVLNVMQQVGGTLGLATLTTVFVSGLQDKTAQITAAAQDLLAQGAQPSSGEGASSFAHQVGNVAFTYGAGLAFLVGAVVIWTGTALVLVMLNARRQDLSTEDTEQPAH